MDKEIKNKMITLILQDFADVEVRMCKIASRLEMINKAKWLSPEVWELLHDWEDLFTKFQNTEK